LFIECFQYVFNEFADRFFTVINRNDNRQQHEVD
jgi:hypothetical protein